MTYILNEEERKLIYRLEMRLIQEKKLSAMLISISDYHFIIALHCFLRGDYEICADYLEAKLLVERSHLPMINIDWIYWNSIIEFIRNNSL